MGRGILIAELVRARDHRIPMRTDDPTNPDPYEPWVRTDLNGETDKLGELRWVDGNGTTKYIWAMAVGSTPSGVEEYWRAQGPNATMVFPVTPRADAVEPALSWNGPSGTLGAWSPPEIAVDTLQPTNIDYNQATLEGELVEIVHTNAVNANFQWRQTGASTWNQTSFQQLLQTQNYNEAVSSLTAETEYEYQALIESDEYPSYTDNGDIVTFTTPSDIPDSAIHQWKYDEGSGTTAADNIGSNDGTINGASWSSVADLVGGYGLSFDSTDDNVDHSAVSAVNFGQDWSVAVTVNADSTSNAQCVWYSGPDGTNTIVLYVQSGELRLDNWNGSSRVDVRSWSGMSTSRIRVGVGWDGSTDTGEIWVDGSQVNDGTNQASFSSSGTQSFRIGENADSGGDNYGGILDNPIVYNSKLSSSEWSEDYNAQPWS